LDEKRAFLKGIGLGLSVPLNSFTVSLGGEEPLRAISQFPNELKTDDWQLRQLNPLPGYQGALAIEADFRAIAVFQHHLGTTSQSDTRKRSA
jgi:4'-phosphopantetheinyl transferase